MLTLFQPVWLLLLVPLITASVVWPLPNRRLQILRVAVWLLVALALARLAIRLPDRAGTVVVVADRSASMPADAPQRETEIIHLLQKSMGPRDQLGVVAFGREAVVEQPPRHTEFGGFTTQVGADHSDLNSALETALAMIPTDGGGRVLVVSDGRWTGRDPAAAAARAAGRGVAVDYRWLARPTASDVAIQSFQAPQSVLPGQAFLLNAWVQSPGDQEIQYRLRRNNEILSAGTKKVSAGLSRLMFRDRCTETQAGGGVREYTLEIQGDKADPVPENNTARALVSVENSRPLLVVSAAGENSGLVKLLRQGGVRVAGRTPIECRWSLEELAAYSAVLLENVPAGDIGMNGLETLADWVEETGSGLALTGGQKAYGPGGYFKSPLERILPISMEMRREHRKLTVAVVVALDRSGSMSMPAGGGRKKIDLADLGTVQVLDLLSPMDEIGVFAVDTAPHEIVSLDTVEKNQSQRSKILAIDSLGGGIYIYEALVASARMISSAKAQTKHIILFADASDSEQSMHYEEIVDHLREAGVTVSVIGLGTDHDCDAQLLKDIARRGGGECYFSSDPDEIPRIFAQDTFTIARSTFIDQPTAFSFTAGYNLLGTPPAAAPPALGGYNLCYLRPQANLAAVTSDEYQAPIVATWNAGNGRVLCYLGEADGKFSGDFAHWNQAGEFYATLARWTAGKHEPLPDEMLLTQEIHDGICYVQLHLDPARPAESFAALPRVRVLHGLPGSAPAKTSLTLDWKTADLLEAAIPIAGRETVLNTVEIARQQPVTLPPACLPYSPEFTPEQPGRGASTLAQMALTTGGQERVEITKIWRELPINPRLVELAPWLLVAAAALFLLEIFERRTGWLSRLMGRSIVATATNEEGATEEASPAAKPKPYLSWLVRKPVAPRTVNTTRASTTPATAPPTVASAPKPAATPNAAPESNLDALRQARERARHRTDKDR
jgi:Mg-chelatase subunit ChlD